MVHLNLAIAKALWCGQRLAHYLAIAEVLFVVLGSVWADVFWEQICRIAKMTF